MSSGWPIDDTAGAFCPHGRFTLAGAPTGPLAGLTFGVKDLIDVAGHVTGAGNPRWLETHAPADATAPSVASLLAAGATMVGKTLTDELAYSLNGDNVHYGTPRNAAAPDRVPGGSSSGSAAAVAAGLCDFALGTDSGGSIRIPASYCGLWGIRTTHARLPMDGVVPLMPSFDTLGWFAADAVTFRRVGAVLLGTDDTVPTAWRLVWPADAEAEVGAAGREALVPALDWLAGRFGGIETARLAPEGLDLWRERYRLVSAAETWAIHGDWIETAEPDFGPAIAERFAYARRAADMDRETAWGFLDRVRAGLHALIGENGLLCLPTAPGPAPFGDAAGDAVEAFRQSAQRLTCIAGIAGLPQISLPVATLDGAPFGLSLIGPAGSDAALLALCTDFEAAARAPKHPAFTLGTKTHAPMEVKQ